MQKFYLLIAFGFILFYVAVVLLIFTYAVVTWLAPMKINHPVVSRSLERVMAWLR
jgi:hypothetical protein